MITTMRNSWQRKDHDPLLDTDLYRTNRAQLRKQATLADAPCSICGLAIRFDLAYPHPLSLVCGHVLSRAKAKRLGWTPEMINARSNLQPEHKRCGQKAGSAEGSRSPARAINRKVVRDSFARGYGSVEDDRVNARVLKSRW
jgi:hypothetical protein